MSKVRLGDRSLEQYRVFPYIAWVMTIGFAVFVLHLTLELRAAAEHFTTRATNSAHTIPTPNDLQ